MPEAVNHPLHYGGDTTFETIKVLRAWMSPQEFQAFCVGNAIKYLSRAGKKGDVLEDLKKSRWYLEYLIGDIEARLVDAKIAQLADCIIQEVTRVPVGSPTRKRTRKKGSSPRKRTLSRRR